MKISKNEIIFILFGFIGVFGVQFGIISFILIWGAKFQLALGFFLVAAFLLIIGNEGMKYYFKKIQIDIWGFVPPKEWGRKK